MRRDNYKIKGGGGGCCGNQIIELKKFLSVSPFQARVKFHIRFLTFLVFSLLTRAAQFILQTSLHFLHISNYSISSVSGGLVLFWIVDFFA
jgi:hypothetical protein